MSAANSTDGKDQSEPRLNLKDRWLALFLAWLIPGLGHLYQGRRFKAAIFFFCILGTFFSGVCLGNGKSVHWSWKSDYRTYWYPAQLMTGIVAAPAYVQGIRQNPKEIAPDRGNLSLDRKLSGECEGTLFDARIGEEEDQILNLDGRIEIIPSAGAGFDRAVSGEFTGFLEPIPGEESPFEEKTPVKLRVTYLRAIDPRIFPSPNREFIVEVEGETTGEKPVAIRGSIQGIVLNSRGIVDSYCAPLDTVGLEQAHGNLGKYFELGMMYTMIAGLLNVLAMWDAFEGPAYGYSDDEEDEKPTGPEPAGA